MSFRVLVVDDVEDAAFILAELVGTLGHTAKYVIDPRKAVGIAAEYQPHIVLLDIGMPHYKRIRARADDPRALGAQAHRHSRCDGLGIGK